MALALLALAVGLVTSMGLLIYLDHDGENGT